MKSNEAEQVRLQAAIAALEAHQAGLGEEVAETALQPLRARLRALEEAVQSEGRKLVTLLFADLVDFTGLTVQLDPEEVREIMRVYFDWWSTCIQAQQGMVEKFIGDAVMAVFGLQRSQEADPRRAIRAALAMQRKLPALNRLLTAHEDVSLAMRVGIHTGRVVVSTLGTAAGQDFVVVGESVNLTSRLQAQAPAGGILISQATYRLTRPYFEVQPQDLLVVKGIAEPLQTYLILKERSREFHGEAGASMRAPMVGRVPELTELQAAFQHVQANQQLQLIQISGAPGVGKSRLLCEFDRWIEAQPDPSYVLRARARNSRQKVPFDLLRQLCADFVSLPAQDENALAGQMLVDKISPYMDGPAERKTHILGALLGFDFTQQAYVRQLQADPAQLRQQGLFYFQQFIRALTARGPVCLLLDDLQWADPASLEALMELFAANLAQPLLGAGAARPEFKGWALPENIAAQKAQVLPLAPLDKGASHQLVAAILGDKQGLPPKLTARLVRTAAGNPYYLEELIQTLLDQGVLQKGSADDPWEVDWSQLRALELPSTLVALLEARLDRMASAEKTLLQRAAVVGRVFWDTAVPGSWPLESSRAEILAGLCAQGVLQCRENAAFTGTQEYAFQHHLLREVAYRSLLKRLRRPYHRQVADWLVQVTQEPDRKPAYASVIAAHYELARADDEAAQWYVEAGQQAQQQGAFRQAYQHFERALANLPEGEIELGWPAWAGLSEVALILGDSAGRSTADQALLDLARAADNDHWLAEAYYRLGVALGESRAALAAYEQGLAAARQVGDARRETLIQGMRLVNLARAGQLAQAAQAAAAALRQAHDLGEEELLARTLSNVAIYYCEIGDLAQGMALGAQAITICRRLENQMGELIGLVNLGYRYTLLGLPGLGAEKLITALQIAAEIGAPQNAWYARLNLGLAAWRAGALPAARRHLQATLAEAEAQGDSFGLASNCVYLGLVLASGEEPEGAVAYFAAAEKRFTDLGLCGAVVDARAGLARCYHQLGRIQEAVQCAAQVWEALAPGRAEGLEFPLLAYQTCAEVFATSGDHEKAQQASVAGVQELETRAARIGQPAWRRAYLENLPEHRALRQMEQALKSEGGG